MRLLWPETKKGREIVASLICFALFTSNKWAYVCVCVCVCVCVFIFNCFNDMKGERYSVNSAGPAKYYLNT